MQDDLITAAQVSVDASLGHLLRHFVPISIRFRIGNKTWKDLYSAFPFSVRNQWILMTAGHCIKRVEEFRKQGATIESCVLLDALGSQAKFDTPVIVDYDGMLPLHFGHDGTSDYGAMIIHGNTRAQLEANGIAAFGENECNVAGREFDFYRLLGVPEDRSFDSQNPGKMMIGTACPLIAKLDYVPEGFPKTDAPMFYGEVKTDKLSTLRGMSGGPILGFSRIGDDLKYWLHAMQVSGMRGKYISGMLMGPFAEALHELIVRQVKP